VLYVYILSTKLLTKEYTLGVYRINICENAFVCRCVFVSRTSKSDLICQHFNAGKVTEKK